MVKLLRVYNTLTLLIVALNALDAQDPQFSSYYATGSYLSPSLAGIGEEGRVFLGIRDQWPQLPNDFLTTVLSFDMYSHRFNSGFGAYILSDQAGSGRLDLTSLNLIYNYKISLGPKVAIRPGLKIGLTSRSINYSRLLFGDQLGFEGNVPISGDQIENERIYYIDSDFSLLVHNEYVWLGSTLHHLPVATQSLTGSGETISMRTSIFGGVRFLYNHGRLLHEETNYYLTFLYMRQKEYQQLNTGIYWKQYPLVLGLWYRGIPLIKDREDYNDALIFKTTFLWEQIQVGYTYDFTLSGVRSYTGGAHELSVLYRFNHPQTAARKKRMKAIPCPKF